MGSTFAELYSDFQDAVKVYTEKLDEQPVSFMRKLTRGMQLFQRQTEYLETSGTITKQLVIPFWRIPANCIRIVEIRDVNNRNILLQGFTQYNRNTDIQGSGMYETPADYDYRLTHMNTQTRLIAVYGRELVLQNDATTDTSLIIYYIPDIPALTQPANPATVLDIWSAWYPINTNFDALFTTTRLVPSLAIFEQAYLDFAISTYLKSVGSQNYKIYEESFMNEVANAIAIKPVYNKEATSLYNMAVWS